METFDESIYYQKYTEQGIEPWFTVWAQYEGDMWGVYCNGRRFKSYQICGTISRRTARRIVDEIAGEYEGLSNVNN